MLYKGLLGGDGGCGGNGQGRGTEIWLINEQNLQLLLRLYNRLIIFFCRKNLFSDQKSRPGYLFNFFFEKITLSLIKIKK